MLFEIPGPSSVLFTELDDEQLFIINKPKLRHYMSIKGGDRSSLLNSSVEALIQSSARENSAELGYKIFFLKPGN